MDVTFRTGSAGSRRTATRSSSSSSTPTRCTARTAAARVRPLPHLPRRRPRGADHAETPGAIRGSHAYAGETLYTDHEVGELLDGLRDARASTERTLVVFTSDHGEEFGEHGWIGHDETLYDEVLHVPLILRAPGLVPAGVRVPRQASLVDLMPTLLELLGVAAPRSIHGRSLVPFLSAPPRGDDRWCSRSW